MCVEPYHSYGEGNIVYCEERICYHYEIRPMNSLYVSDHQLQTLIDSLHRKIFPVDISGAIYILPQHADEQDILKYYKTLYEMDDGPQIERLHRSFMKDIKAQLTNDIRYRYRIHICFTDNRDPLKKKWLSGWLSENNGPLEKRMVDLSEATDEQIYKKLTMDLSVERLDEKEIQRLYDYLTIPIEMSIPDYHTIPQATELEYNYQTLKNEGGLRELHSRVLIADKLIQDRLEDGYRANVAANEIRFYTFPVDTTTKLDLEHTQTFKSDTTGKREEVRKNVRRYWQSSGRKDKEAQKVFELAKIGEDVDPPIEDPEIRWQMMLRARVNTQDMLMKRSDKLQKRFEGKWIQLVYTIGEQEQPTEHLPPYRSSCYWYVNLIDVLYFAHFNFFDGLYTGEVDRGVVLTYTRPAGLLVRTDIETPIKGLTQTGSSMAAFVGETGSGKSQIANYLALLSMIFYGYRLLLADPKGDRHKLVKLLDRFGDLTSHLIIGDPSCPNGMFDVFLSHPDSPLDALAAAKSGITALVHAINPQQEADLMQVDEACMELSRAINSGKITRTTMRRLVDVMMNKDPKLACSLYSLRNDPMARLSFGDDDTDISKVFRLDHPFNLITFAKMPVYSKDSFTYTYDSGDLERRIFSLILGRVNEITNMFLRTYKGQAKTILFDEAKLYPTVPGGTSVLVNNNLIARPELCDMLIILQNWSDLPDPIINNTGQFFIGNMKSKDEIQRTPCYLDLDSNSTLSAIPQDRTKEEGVDQAKQHNFLYCDYNNRKCLTKMTTLPIFSDAPRTFKDIDEQGAGS